MQPTDEQQLIARILNGHAEEYGYFLTRYGEEVFQLVVRLVPQQQDAEELVQDAFVRAYDKLDTYTGEASFHTWLCRIAYNLTISWLRKQKMKYTSIDERLDVSDADVDQLLDDDSRIQQLKEACTQLKPDEQTLIYAGVFHLLLAQPTDGKVVGNTAQPSLEGRLACIGIQFVVGTDESILHQFLSILLLGNQSYNELEDLLAVTCQEIAVFLGVAVEDTGYQLLFVRLLHQILNSSYFF